MNCSAAKAPYRATFRVQTVGIEQVEHCADPNYELMQDSKNQYAQMAIFKVGDDVRRVKLIFFFRNQKLRLVFFLFFFFFFFF